MGCSEIEREKYKVKRDEARWTKAKSSEVNGSEVRVQAQEHWRGEVMSSEFVGNPAFTELSLAISLALDLASLHFTALHFTGTSAHLTSIHSNSVSALT